MSEYKCIGIFKANIDIYKHFSVWLSCHKNWNTEKNGFSRTVLTAGFLYFTEACGYCSLF